MTLPVFLLLTALCNYSFTMQNVSIGMKNFTHTEFSIEYPDSWTLDTAGSWGEAVGIYSPLENPEDKFSENLNVLIQDLGGQAIDLEGYKQITDQQITQLAPNGKIIESTIVTGNGDDFYRIIYTMTQAEFNLKITSICHIQNGKAYLVTFSAEEDQFEKYKTEGEKILASFRLKKVMPKHVVDFHN